MGRAEVGVAKDLGHRSLEVFEVPGSGVGLVADELTRELLLAHGARAVGAHVEGHLGRGEVERIEMGLRQVLLPLLEGREGEEANGFDFMGFVGHHGGVSCNGSECVGKGWSRPSPRFPRRGRKLGHRSPFRTRRWLRTRPNQAGSFPSNPI